MKQRNPDYTGFRGYAAESTAPDQKSLEKVTCSVCGRVRNIPLGVAAQHKDDYVCATCQEEMEREAPEDVASSDEEETLEDDAPLDEEEASKSTEET
jgi:hypothetical protein